MRFKGNKLLDLANRLSNRFPVGSIIKIIYNYGKDVAFYKVAVPVYIDYINGKEPDTIRIPLQEYDSQGKLRDERINQNIADRFGLNREIKESSFDEMLEYHIDMFTQRIKKERNQIKHSHQMLYKYQKDLRELKKVLKDKEYVEKFNKRI